MGLNDRYCTEYKLQTVGDLVMRGVLPPIMGRWFHVNPNTAYNQLTNPYPGQDANDGLSRELPMATINAAYTACYSGRGDGIILYSNGTTTANTTSYLSASLTWSKWGITVIGACAPTWHAQRSRIGSASTATDLTNILTISGSNNAFYNLHFTNEGSDAAAVGCVAVTGNRNYFGNCHMAGAVNATPGAVATAYDLYITGAENTFERCTCGTNTITHAAANAAIVFDGSSGKNMFIDCRTLSKSETAGHGAIKVYDTAGVQGWNVFKGCIFTNAWFENGAATALTSVVIGSTSNNVGILIDATCGQVGWAAWAAAVDRTYVLAPTASATGGIAATPS